MMTLTPLSHVAEVIMGTAPPGETYNTDGQGLPMIAGAGDYGDRHPCPKKWTTAASAIAKPGDVIICVRATIGDLNWADREYCLGRGVAAIRARRETTTAGYLSHALQAVRPMLLARATGSTFPAVRRGDVEDLLIPIPYADDRARSLSEQQRITAILDKADAILGLRRRVYDHATRIRQAALQELIALSPADSQFRLSEIGEVSGGLALSQRRHSLPMQRPYLRVANVYRDRLLLTEIKTIGLEPGEFEKTRLAEGDVLIVEGHGNREELGRSAVWDGSIADCVHQNHLIRVRCNRARCLPQFLSAYVNSIAGRRQMLKHGKTTSGLNTISISDVRSTIVHLPPLCRQLDFAKLVQQQGRLQSKLNAATKTAADLLASLATRAFRGEL